MKAVVVIVVLLVAGLVFLNYSKSSTEQNFDPNEQGKQAREIAESCKTWTEVIERVGPPKRWRDSTSNFDFTYHTRFDDTTTDFITKKLEKNDYRFGFSFFYRFSDAVTFAVNFDREGKLSNIQDKEGKGDLLGE